MSSLLCAGQFRPVPRRGFGRSLRALLLACRGCGDPLGSRACFRWDGRRLPARRPLGFGSGRGLQLICFHVAQICKSRRHGQLFALLGRSPRRIGITRESARHTRCASKRTKELSFLVERPPRRATEAYSSTPQGASEELSRPGAKRPRPVVGHPGLEPGANGLKNAPQVPENIEFFNDSRAT